jgi:hypothetical protein
MDIGWRQINRQAPSGLKKRLHKMESAMGTRGFFLPPKAMPLSGFFDGRPP